MVASTSALTPVAAAARPARRWATASAAAPKRSFSAGRSASSIHGPSVAGSCTAPTGRITGPTATPGTTGVPVSTTGRERSAESSPARVGVVDIRASLSLRVQRGYVR